MTSNNSNIKKKHTRNKQSLRTIILIATALLLISIVFLILIKTNVIFLGTDTQSVTFSNIEDVSTFKSSFSINLDSPDYIYSFDDSIIKYQTRKISWLQENGNVLKTSEESYDAPMFSSNGSYMVVGEKGQNLVSVYKDSSLVWSEEMGGEVHSISINASGYVSLVRNFTGYKSAFEVYDPNGKQIFYTCKAKNKIVNTYVMDDNEHVLVNSISLSDIDIVTYAEIFDMTGKIISTYTATDVCLDVIPLNETTFVAVFDDRIAYFDTEGKVLHEISDLAIKDIIVTDDKELCLLATFTNETQNRDKCIMVYNERGDLLEKLIFDRTINGISKVREDIGVNLGNLFIVTSTSGDILGGCSSEKQIQRIFALTSSRVMAFASDEVLICNY